MQGEIGTAAAGPMAEREAFVELMQLVNLRNNARELIKRILWFLKTWSGCDAVGVRLREGEDFTYFETNGFPGHFVQMENRLCSRDAEGTLLRDCAGQPVLDCMCGNIIQGRFDPQKPFFTPGGSFWTNSTTELLATTSESDRQARTRNRCNGEGYESVALIPLRSRGETFGLMQMNDRRKGRFSPELLVLLERLASVVGLILWQRQAEEALRRKNEELAATEEELRAQLEEIIAGREALKESEERFRTTLDGMIEGCQILGHDFKYLFVNEAASRQGKKPEEELLGRTMMECYPGIEKTEMFAALQRCLTTRTPQRMENEFTFPDGSNGCFELSIQPVPEGLLILSEDITERKSLEEQLLQSQKMEAVGQLAGGVAHDFNNVLTAILGYSELILEDLPEEHPQRSRLDEIIRAGERAASLTGQLLAFSRKQVLQPEVLCLNEVVTETGKMLRRMIGEDIELVTVLDPALERVKVDPVQIEQVLMNLAVNARDAMPRGGKLSIETANAELDEAYSRSHPEVQPGNYVMLAVSDTGCGMDEATQARIFEPFFTTKERGKGTGLGLSTVYGIVKQSGGSLFVYSEPGKGTVFKAYFPPAPRVMEDLEPLRPPAAPPRDLAGAETILVAEDDEVIRTLIKEVLESQGYSVLSARRGEEALRLAEEHSGPIHLLVTDVVMPQMGGRDLAQSLVLKRPEVKVLFMSGYTDEAIVHHGVLEPGLAFLAKPFTPETLLKKVREVLDAPEGPGV